MSRLAADRAQLLELRPLIERIIRYAHFRGANQESVEDKVQKALVRALDGLRRGEERPEGLTAWVISIARNVASSERRTKRRTASLVARAGLALVPRMAIASAEPPRTEPPSSPASLIAPPPRPAAPPRTPTKVVNKRVLQGPPPSSPFNETIDEADLFIVDGR